MKIWVDDIRTPPDETWIWSKTSAEAINLLTQFKYSYSIPNVQPEVISLDHDLGKTDKLIRRGKCVCGETTPENRLGHADGCRYFADSVYEDDTARPIVMWMIENDFWPAEVLCHSQNPVGRDWIEQMIERYKTN